jgi:GTPase SAR1 family protein
MESPKVVLLGASGVGKTNLSRVLAGCRPRQTHIPTFGVEIAPVTSRHKYSIWDLAGDPKYGGFERCLSPRIESRYCGSE